MSETIYPSNIMADRSADVADQTRYQDLKKSVERIIQIFRERVKMLARVSAKPNSFSAYVEALGIEQVIATLQQVYSSNSHDLDARLICSRQDCAVCTSSIVTWESPIPGSGWRCSCGCTIGYGDTEAAATAKREQAARKRMMNAGNDQRLGESPLEYEVAALNAELESANQRMANMRSVQTDLTTKVNQLDRENRRLQAKLQQERDKLQKIDRLMPEDFLPEEWDLPRRVQKLLETQPAEQVIPVRLKISVEVDDGR